MEECGVTAQSFHLCSLPNLGLTPVMPFFPLSGAGSTCVFPAFGARPSPTGDLPFLPPRASQCPPDTEKQRHASRWGNASGSKSWSTGGNPPAGLGLASHWSYSRLEKVGEKGNELPHLMTRKKMCFGQIFTLGWLIIHLVQSQPNDLDPIYPMILCSLNMGYSSLPISYFLFFSSFLPTRGKKGSFWISGKLWYFHLGWAVAPSF